MAQYFIICNFDKKEFLNPEWFGQLSKVADIARPADSMMVGLACLLTLSGSDLYAEGPFYGRWAGDPIAFLGDYYWGSIAEYNVYGQDTFFNITDQHDGWVDISEHLRRFLESTWELVFPPPLVDGTTPRSVLHEDGTITATPNPILEDLGEIQS